MGYKALERLEKKLGYHFKDRELLKLALSHRSAGNNNNERLEFLGDSVLGFVVAEELYQRFPKASEGEMTRMRAHLVRGDTLAQLAQEIELGHFLTLGSGEMKSGGHRRASILADTMEALLGGIYLESGITACQECIIAWYGERLNDTTLLAVTKDNKTRLQEWLQGRKLDLPHYRVVATHGEDHNMTFDVECTVTDSHNAVQMTLAKGKSRRSAEQKAAKTMLELLSHE